MVIIAFHKVDVSKIMVIDSLGPIFAILINVCIYNQKIGFKTVYACIISFIGAFMIIEPNVIYSFFGNSRN